MLKPLLTKEERRSLSADERRALKAERRAARKAERAKIDVDDSKLMAVAEELVLDAVADALPGEEKMEEILDELAVRADEFMVWTWAGPLGIALEMADGPLAKAAVRYIVKPRVQALYDKLKTENRL